MYHQMVLTKWIGPHCLFMADALTHQTLVKRISHSHILAHTNTPQDNMQQYRQMGGSHTAEWAKQNKNIYNKFLIPVECIWFDDMALALFIVCNIKIQFQYCTKGISNGGSDHKDSEKFGVT